MKASEFKNIYDLYFDPIRKFIFYKSGSQDLANDIAQSTFMKIWTLKIDVKQNNIKNLLYKMANNKFIDHVRHTKVKHEYQQYYKNSDLSEEEEQVDNSQEKKKLNNALKILPEEQRIVLIMNKIEGLTQAEISDFLGISIKTVEKRISKAFVSLRNSLS